MLAISRALMSRPRLVIFDEISLGLAPVVIDRLYEALRMLRENGLTMLIIEQDIERALDLVDRALCPRARSIGYVGFSRSRSGLTTVCGSCISARLSKRRAWEMIV